MFSFNLSVNEKLIKVYRQSESRLIKPALLAMAAIYIPIWFLYQYFLLPRLAWALALWTLIVLLYGINKYLLWLVTTYIITSKRAVAVTYSSLMKRQTEEILIKDIASIRQKSTGILSHLFKFGTIELEGGGALLEFKDIPNPSEAKSLIGSLKDQ